jgi:hypothetical protein
MALSDFIVPSLILKIGELRLKLRESCCPPVKEVPMGPTALALSLISLTNYTIS